MSDRQVRPAAQRQRTFAAILANTAVANLTTSYLFFALVSWVYLETQNVIATGVIGGGYMLTIALCSIAFGTFVDRYRKLAVMRASGAATAVAFACAGLVFAVGGDEMSSLTSPWLWFFAGVVLAGSVVEVLRDVALSTTVTILIDSDRRANANGYVGAVQGLSFIVTSVFSGLSVGFLGMGPTIVCAVVLTVLGWLHLWTIRMPEEQTVAESDARGAFDVSGAWAAVTVVPGLIALIGFSMFNNFTGGVYMALLDPYGLELFSVQMWGVVFAVGATGFLLGGVLIGRFGLGANPIRTMLWAVVALGVICTLFAVRESAWTAVVGVWLFMLTMTAVEAAEQTVIQRVVPLPQQGRVFGLAGAVEAGAAPVTAFVVAPLAETFVIPYARSADGAATLEPWLGTGDARGIAAIFVVTGVLTIVVALLAFATPVYREVSAAYQTTQSEAPASSDPVLER